jgi:hypothetical protein
MTGLKVAPFAGAIFAAISTLPAKAEQFRSGDWQAECAVDVMTDRTRCVIKLTLVQQTAPPGAFALVVGPGYISLIGQPPISFAQLRVDNNLAMTCRGINSCDLSTSDANARAQQLSGGPQLLLRIATPNAVFDFSDWADGYRQCLTAVSRWGFSLDLPVPLQPRRK